MLELKGGKCMAKYDNDFVDISSSADVRKAYGKQYPAQQQPKRKKRGTVRRAIVLTLSLIMLLVGSGLVFYDHVLSGLVVDDDLDAPDPTQNITETTTVSVKSGGASLLSSDNVLNIMLFGQDAAESEEDHGRSDTTILLSIDNVHQKIKMTSFQRDTYVSIPGHGDGKLNSAYTLGGERLSINTIEQNFGIKVDKYATVDFDSFREIISVLGGVDIELNQEEIRYINAQIDVNDQTDVTNFIEYDPNLETQVVHLDEYQALWYARNRGETALGGNPEYSFSGDDWDRTQRQRKLLQTIIKSLREEASLTKLVAIANKIGPYVTTNLTKGDITFLLSNVLTYMGYDMEELSVPTENTWRYGMTDDGQSVIVITDWDGARGDMASFIYEDSVAGTVKKKSTSAPTFAATEAEEQQQQW